MRERVPLLPRCAVRSDSGARYVAVHFSPGTISIRLNTSKGIGGRTGSSHCVLIVMGTPTKKGTARAHIRRKNSER